METTRIFLLVFRQACLFRCVPSSIFDFHERYKILPICVNLQTAIYEVVVNLKRVRREEGWALVGQVYLIWANHTAIPTTFLMQVCLGTTRPAWSINSALQSLAWSSCPVAFSVQHFTFTPPSIYSHCRPPRPLLLGGLQLARLSLYFLFAPSFATHTFFPALSRYSRSRAPEA